MSNTHKHKVTVISLGGSIVSPDKVDTAFLEQFMATIRTWLSEDNMRKVIMVTGGGNPARVYQQAYRDLSPAPDHGASDWIGIAATRLNAELLRALFSDLCENPVVTNPTAPFDFTGRVLIAAGWKPGFSTDNDAVVLAERFGASRVLNLSNIAYVYTADPKKDPSAKPITEICWKDMLKITGTEWVPGKHSPLDPVAAKRGSELGLEVITALGGDVDNLVAILNNQPYKGTKIGPM